MCVRPCVVRACVRRSLIFRPVLDWQNTDSKGICRKNCSVLGPTLPFLDHSPGSSGFEDLEDLGSETDKRGSEDQPSEAKSAPVVFFCEAGESTSLVCPEFELSFCWSNRCKGLKLPIHVRSSHV